MESGLFKNTWGANPTHSITNGGRIRSMNNQKLAEYLMTLTPTLTTPDGLIRTAEECLKWLESKCDTG